MTYIVMDTNVLIYALREDEYRDDAYRAWRHLTDTGEYGLALDDQSFIEHEYRKNFPNGRFQQRQFQLEMMHLYRQQRVERFSSDLSDAIRDDLKRVHFHEEEDQVFVGVAVHADHMIVSEDSDYGIKNEPGHEEAYQYLTHALGLKLYSAEEFGIGLVLNSYDQGEI